mmetsp:Transcript_4380/g.6764  ORF Transcript_4380/g.6764 Transcript_4380/m.6764 type:complete len:194 (+) Transcript_4380:477-1058(+)
MEHGGTSSCFGTDVYGKTVGIVGMGRIGLAVARRLALGFGCKVIYHQRTEKTTSQLEGVPAKYVSSLDELLAESDIVTMHLPYQGTCLCDAAFFSKMKRTALFINTTRGGMVNQDALYDALVSGQIAGAGLDVTTPEPLPLDHKLLTLSNCVIFPHIGSATLATREKMSQVAIDNAIAGLEGKPMIYCANDTK